VVHGDDRLHFRPVAVLRIVGEQAYISAGLTEGERVVVSPMNNAVEGMTVRTEAAAPVAGSEGGA
jgi:hypothetical protein